MKLLAYIYRASPYLLIFGITLTIVTGLLSATLMAIINAAIAGHGETTTLVWQFLGVCVLHTAARSLSSLTLLNASQSAIQRLRIDLSRKLLGTPQAKLQQIGKPQLLAILTQDITTVMQACQRLTIVLAESVIIFGCLIYISLLSWKMLLLFVLLALGAIAVIRIADWGPFTYLRRARANLGHLYRHFRDLVEGSRELQVNAARGTAFIDETIIPETASLKRDFIRGLGAYVLVTNGVGFFYLLVIGIVLFIVPHWVPQPRETTISIAMAFVYLAIPISELVKSLPELRQGGIALSKVKELDSALTLHPKAPHEEENPFASNAPMRLELREVSHRYQAERDDSQFILGPINLTIRKGEVVFIVGGNGSGKTTLAMMLLGLYEPEAGAILLNHQRVTPERLDCYRQHFSVIFSDFHLFEQLLMSKHEALTACAQRYIRALGLEHKVKMTDDGRFSTIDLSTGQRKRLALVAALLEDRPIYLFDEWAADQDPIFKRIFYTQLLPDLKARGKTVLVITHDEQYFPHADRIIKLEQGLLCNISSQTTAHNAVAESVSMLVP